MQYKLLKKQIGVRETQILLEFENEYVIKDICCINKDTILFSAGNYIGKIENYKNIVFPYVGCKNGENRKGSANFVNLYNPSAILQSPFNIEEIYIVENGGVDISLYNISEDYFSQVFGEYEQHKLKNYCKRISGESTTQSCFSSNIFYWTIPSCHRIVSLDSCVIKTVVGNGKAGFSTSNNLNNCQVFNAQGITSINGEVYISDTNNNCIRTIKNNLILSFGNPSTTELEHPKKILEHSNFLYVQDDIGIKIINIKGPKKINILYDSKNIVSMTFQKDKSLIILEKK